MPYTPPSHRSPASSTSASPDVSRRSSITSGQRPSLPRSASYLNKHRRTPSASSLNDASHTPSPPYATSDELRANAAVINGSLRKSPPPVTDDRGIPNAAIISPPDSAESGSEDEGRPEIRGRKLGKLRDAVSQIPQTRTPSPPNQQTTEDGSQAVPPPRSIMRPSFSATTLKDLPPSPRRVPGHVRSATDPNATLMMVASESSLTASEDSDDDLKKKPQMVRKKSGELVRPALRPAHRRPSSMPGTPVFAKAVHFDSHLEHIRHFLQVDRPLAVSAGSSPVENYDSDTEFPFHGEKKPAASRSPPFEWQLVANNFPHDSPSRRAYPVRLEKIWLSADQKTMLGSIAVSNLAFQKSVVCRFTLDYWKTTSEVAAEYHHEIRPRETSVSQDRFQFSIKLSDTINLETKTLFFCVRYNVNGQDYWDSNNGANFQVDFKKQHKPVNGKNNFQGAASRPANGLPHSNRRQKSTTTPRPVSLPASLDEFSTKAKFNFEEQPIHEYLGETGSAGLRLKTKSTSNLASDNITKGLTSPSGVAFSNRYDFGASLSAAVQAAKDSTVKEKDTLYMKRNVRDSPPIPGIGTVNIVTPVDAVNTVNNKPAVTSQPPLKIATTTNATSTPPTASPSVGLGLGLASSSYEELVSKYCFFGSKQSSTPMLSGSVKSSEAEMPKKVEQPSVTVPGYTPRRTGPAAHHHGLHLDNLKAYTAPTTGFTSSSAPPTVGRDHSNPKIAALYQPQPSPYTVATTSPSEVNYFKQQMLPERFPWGGDSHAATAIRG